MSQEHIKIADSLFEPLAKAGTEYDGHVTNGSITQQMKVIQQWLAAVCPKCFGHGSEKFDACPQIVCEACGHIFEPGKPRPRMNGIAFQTDSRQTYPNGEIRGPKIPQYTDFRGTEAFKSNK